MARRGAAAVEFAIIAPLLFLLILGMIELGRALMVMDLLASAARHGARKGVIAGRSNADIERAVTDFTAGVALQATTTIRVNGAVGDATSARPGDSISVTVSVPAQSASWLPVSRFVGDQTLSRTVLMQRE